MDPHSQHAGKRIRGGMSNNMSPASSISDVNATPSSPVYTATALDTLPTVALSHIASFACGKLSEACGSTLAALPELHYKISIKDEAKSFSLTNDPSGILSRGHMGVQPSGALITGRVVTHITVTGCTDYKSTQGGYQILEKTVQSVVRHSIPTLRSITVKGTRGKDSGRVAAIVGVLVPVSSKRHRVAPRLTRVELHHGANGIVKAGRALVAGLWPALEELEVPNCHANTSDFFGLLDALTSGRAPKLRVLNWNNQSIFKDGVDEAILWGLRAGKCPHVEHLSFTNAFMISEMRMDSLRGALQACPKLREVRMDCTKSPREQLRDLTATLQGGDVPQLAFLYIRVLNQSHRGGVDVSNDQDVDALKRAAASRIPPVRIEVKSMSSI